MKLTEISNKLKAVDYFKVGEVVLVGIIMAAPFVALAAGSVLNVNCSSLNGVNCTQNTGLVSLAVIVLNWILGVAGLVAVIFLIWGGFRYLTAGGNEDSTKAARTTIINALIGLVIIILAYVIVSVVVNSTNALGTSVS